MNPETKAVLDALTQRFESLEASVKESGAKWEKGFAESSAKWEKGFEETEEKWEICFSQSDDKWERQFADLVVAQDARVEALERVATSFEDWRPGLEGTLDDVCLEVSKLSKNRERAMRDRSPPLLPTVPPSSRDPMLQLQEHFIYSSASGRPPAADFVDSPSGHCSDNYHRVDGFGSITTVAHPPVKGAYSLPSPPLHDYVKHSIGNLGRLPKLNFPKFDGVDPKLWLSRCLDYFELYAVEQGRWIMVATMHFIPPTSHWLPSVETRLKSCSWLQFASMLLDRFGRDQHELLVPQLINIKQFGSVSEYIDRFAGLVDQLAAYEGPPISLNHTMRFIDGLKDELKSAVLIQCPKDIDTAYILAQLQEDLYESAGKKREYRKLESSFPSKPYFKTASPTLSQNARHNKASSSVAEDRRTTDSARATSADDKWRSPKEFRRSKGLCQFCAERWTKEHKCADNIHLNVVQELMAIFQSDEDEDSDTGEAPQIYMTLSVAALSGLPAPRTLCLSGDIQNHKISILVDSGSSHSFICSSVASKLQGVCSLQSPLSVKVANGQKLSCSTHIVNAAWYVDGFLFSH
jgi:hypothetical protein